MNIKNLLHILLAIFIAEAILLFGTTYAQDLLFDGVHYRSADSETIALAGFLRFVVALLSGLIARLIYAKHELAIPTTLIVLIIVEMAYLIATGITKDPVWFDVLSGTGLILGVWIGYHYKEVFSPSLPDIPFD